VQGIAGKGIPLLDQYIKDIENSFDWDTLARECRYDGEVFLGTVFAIFPSGKYSNYLTCPTCDGEGCKDCGNIGSVEAMMDEVYSDALDTVANNHGLYVTSGEDPCDILVGLLDG
jgi:hypothetical protein